MAETVHDTEPRNPKTAPMLQMPEFEAPAVRPTLPMAEERASARGRSDVARTARARRVAWITLGLVGSAGVALLLIGVSGGRFAPWRSEAAPEAPPGLWIPAPEGQGGTEPITTTPAEEPETSAPPEPEHPPAQSSRGGASSKPSTPATPAKPAPPSPKPPAPPLPAPPLPAPSLPTPPLPAPPAPSLPAPPLPLPQLPWTLPTAGACERCLQALRGSGHYTVVSAAAEALLCEDRAALANCEREIDEAAPGVAERAAREGNCAAALATVAAVNVRVPPERFGAVNALCLR